MRSGGSKRLNSRQACRRPLLLYLLLSSGWASAQAPETERAPVGPEPGQQPAVTAQTPPDQQPIVITGSRIPRPNLTAPSPVSVINKEEVTLQGAVLTEDLPTGWRSPR